MSHQHAFTVDVEDYFQVSAFEGIVPRGEWDRWPSRVVANTHRILDLCAKYSVRGTFYVLGWVAEKFPDLVRDIDAAGHELGSHSYWHRLIYSLDREVFREDLRRSKEVLEGVTGKAVTTFRAPSFSITRKSEWALEVLVEEGFTTDSSIFPVYHDRYGIPGAPATIHQQRTPSGTIWEFPPSILKLGKFALPVAGGGYFRLYPGWFFRGCVRRVEASGHPYVFYIHPWEIDPDQPRMEGLGAGTRFRHYVNLSRSYGRLERDRKSVV